ncbi:unnamed protein product [Moneuplotes crassus]|uniref:Uncharacterized protein n=1 Tax=Euplotes crassus TaxID=5936 RepID=A0AAD2D087_EUPCR|nr:unnamed protein product [Moneuplotes crassus]
MGCKTSRSTRSVNIKTKLLCRKIQQLLDTVYDDETQELKYKNIHEFWEKLKNDTVLKKKKKNTEARLAAFYSFRFANSEMKISHLLIVHLKEEHMIELMRKDNALQDSIKNDLDSEGNTCGHIALMYNKQKVLSELFKLSPNLAVIENKKGQCITEMGERFRRTFTDSKLLARMVTFHSDHMRQSLLSESLDSDILTDSLAID